MVQELRQARDRGVEDYITLMMTLGNKRHDPKSQKVAKQVLALRRALGVFRNLTEHSLR